MIIIDTNLEQIYSKLDYKLCEKIEKTIIRKVTQQVKKDIKSNVRRLIKHGAVINKYITSNVFRNGTGLIKAKYIAKWHETGIKDRIPRKGKFMYFKIGDILMRKTNLQGFMGKGYMEKGERDIESKYDNYINNITQEVLNKVLGG